MTLSDKQNEALAGLVGWAPGGPAVWGNGWVRKDGSWRRGCPNMATPEGMVQLMLMVLNHHRVFDIEHFCLVHKFVCIIREHCTAIHPDGIVKRRAAEEGDSLGEATALAVHALLEGRYLTEKEHSNGTDS